MSAVRDKTRRICESYRRRIASGEFESAVIAALSAEHEVQRPAIWKALRAGGVIAPYASKTNGGRGRPTGGGEPGFTAKRIATAMTAAERREDRIISSRPATFEPCGRCGVRADVGCAHQAPAGPKPLSIERAEAQR